MLECLALRARTYPYEGVKRTAEATLDGALTGFFDQLEAAQASIACWTNPSVDTQYEVP